MIAQLVAVRADVPGFRNELDRRQFGILQHGIEKTGAGVETGAFAPQRDAQIEAETVHAIGAHPVAQRIGDHLQHARMRQVDRIAAAGVVDVVPLLARDQAVVAGVVQAAPGQRRSQFVAFAGVVVDHVQDDLQARRVQPADGLAQFVRAVLQVRGLGREERQRVVAPVVAQAAFQQETVLQEGVHRQQLDRGDAQALQVLDEARVGQRRGGAAQGLAQVLALH